MKNILMCANSLRGGGSERQLFILASSLSKKFGVHVFSLESGYFHNKLTDVGIPVYIHSRKNKYDFSPFLELRRIILSLKPEVVHSWDWMQSISAAPVCKANSIGLVSGCIRTGRVPPKAWFGMLVASRVSNISVANSKAGFNAFHLRSKDKVIYNGIIADHFNQIAIRNSSPLVCTMCASFLPSKDHSSVFRVAKQLASNEKFHFIFAGNGPLYSKFKVSYKNLLLSGSVEMPGFVDNTAFLLAKSHVGILLSNAYEGLSNSIMEYMAAGLPVIATNTGGNPELVCHGENGFLINPGDWQSLENYIYWFADNPEQRERMGKSAQAFIFSNFSVDSMVSKTIDAYYAAILDVGAY